MNGAGEEIRTLDIDLGNTTKNVVIGAAAVKMGWRSSFWPKKWPFSVGNSVDFLWKLIYEQGDFGYGETKSKPCEISHLAEGQIFYGFQ